MQLNSYTDKGNIKSMILQVKLYFFANGNNKTDEFQYSVSSVIQSDSNAMDLEFPLL